MRLKIFLIISAVFVFSTMAKSLTLLAADNVLNSSNGYGETLESDILPELSVINSLEYFPISPGTTWKYLVDGKRTSTVSVLNNTVEVGGVETTVFYYQPAGAKEFYTSDSNGIRLHRISQPNVYIQGLGYVNLSLTFIPPIVYGDEWVEIGQTFESSGIVRTNSLPLVGVIEFPYAASFTFERFDNITVPAGDFLDVGVLSGTLTIEGESESQSFYLAEGLGVIKTTSTIEGNTITSELVSTNAGYVTLLTPNGGEVIPAGSTYDISWEASEDASYFNLKYSMDNGATWLPIPGAENVTENHYLWKVPTPTGNKRSCRVKVTAYNAANINVETDISDAPFTIKVVKLVQPDGGEILSSGSSYPIQWEINETKFPVTKVNLYYTTDKGVSYVLISTLAGSDRSFNWTVPTPLSNKKNTCYVKVVAYNGSTVVGSDTSDAPFTIEVVKLVQPNGGEVLKSGDSYSIQWEINGTKSPVTKVNLYYTTDKGVSYVLISTLAGSDRSFNWTVPTPLSNKKNTCYVKVVAYNGSTVVGSDTSDAPFTIEVVKIVQPNGGEILSSGSSYPIQWEINGTKSPVTKVKLYYTTNKGVSYVLITSIPTVDPGTRPWTMSYPWTPTVISEKPYCRVKVVLYGAKNIILSSDVSDNYFTLSP